MKKNQPIFEFLKENSICYSVCVNENTFKVEGVEYNSKDYFILIAKADYPKMGDFYFTRVETDDGEDYRFALQRDLKEYEIDQFREIETVRFDKIEHGANGRIYELKGNSFKKYYNEIKGRSFIK